MKLCYPVKEKIVSSDQSCPTEWEIVSQVGEHSAYGEIWTACCGTDCAHVLKFLPYDGNSREAILNEIEIQTRCSELGLCPRIRDAWFCDEGGAIVMEVFDQTVKQLLIKFKSDFVRTKILSEVLALVDLLHQHGIYHGDLHWDNIMVRVGNQTPHREDESGLYADLDYSFFLIDLGQAGYIQSKEDMRQDYQILIDHLVDLYYEDESDPGLYRLVQMLERQITKFD
jgi:tRNA A-37 threonylcarbamoyl transferase component Bud32